MLDKMDNSDCEHVWVANSGAGGEPKFKMNRHMSHDPLMHVKCTKCGGRTWLTDNDWDAITDPTEQKGV